MTMIITPYRQAALISGRRFALPRAAVLCAILCIPMSMPLMAATDALSYKKQTLMINGMKRTVRIPTGYTLEVLTSSLDGPRLLTFADNGDLFMGSKSGKVYRLPPPYNRPQVLIKLDKYPHSVAFRPGEILIAQEDGLYRAPYWPGKQRLSRQELSLLAVLPHGGKGHISRTVRIGPDGRVYVSLGIRGNCSNQYLHSSYPFMARRGGVLVLKEDGGNPYWETYASGLRNPVGFDWHPKTKVMYAGNNGPGGVYASDNGSGSDPDQPPEYFSRLNWGSFHGMPWFQYIEGKLQRDPCIKSNPPRPKEDVVLPAVTFPAHSAPMAVTFVPRGTLDPKLNGDAIVALRGSYEAPRADPTTRRPPSVAAVRFNHRGKPRRVDNLITGFQLKNGQRWARPVGLAIGPDGALYFSSDFGANTLFRLRRNQ